MLGFNWRRWTWLKFGRKSGTSATARRKLMEPAIEPLEERTLLTFSAPIITDYEPVTGFLVQEATGDFNGDGKIDIATLSYLQLSNPLVLTVLQGNGDGTFQEQASINLSPVFDYTGLNLTVGKVNGDNYDDLVMLEGSLQMKVYAGSASGLSAANSTVTNLAPTLPTGGQTIQSGELVLGHFTRTDRLDAAILPVFGNVVRLLVNQGNGTFVENLYSLPQFNSQTVDFNINQQNFNEGNQILIEDLNHDGIDDTIFAFGGLGTFPNQQTGILTIKKTSGSEGFAVSAIAPNSAGQDMVGADLNADGLLDIAVNSFEGTGGLRLLKGQADGSFTPFASSPYTFVSPDTPIESMAFGNVIPGAPLDLVFNPKDGIPDDNNGGMEKYVFGVAAGQGNGAYGMVDLFDRHQRGASESLITKAGRILIADVNNDGAADLIDIYRNFDAGQNARTSVLLNQGGTYTGISFPDIEEGSPVTIVASVAKSSAEATGAPGGAVTFMEGNTVLGTATLIDGTATSDLLFLEPGQHTIRAVYSGDSQFFSSASSATQINVIVNPGRTKTTLTFPNLVEGQALVQADVSKYFAATPGVPSGNITFKEGNTIIGQGTLVGGQIVAPLDLGPGTHQIYAVYNGDGTFTANTSKAVTIFVQHAPLPDLGLLRIEAEGQGLHFNRSNQHFEANGVIHLGLSQDPFQSLIDLSGSISIGDGKVIGDGTVTAHIGNFTAVLFSGQFQFNIGDAHTNEFNVPALPGALKIAGLDVDYNQLELVNGGINLGGRLHLPNLFEGKIIDLAVGAGIHIDASGVTSHFGGGVIAFPAVNFDLAGLGITGSDFSLDYDANQDRLKIQGKLGLPDMFGGFIPSVQVDLAGSNFIQIQHGEVDFSGELSIKRIDIVPNVWTLKDVKLHVNTLTNAFEGAATLVMPGGFGVKADVGLVNGQLDTVQLGVSGLNVAVPLLPGAFLKSVEGGVSGLTTDHPTFSGKLGFTYLPHISFDLPEILGGQHFSISIVSLSVDADVNNEMLKAKGTVELLKGVSGTGQNNGSPTGVVLDWIHRTLALTTEMHLINNIIDLEVALKATGAGNVSFKADATVNLPAIDTGFLNIHINPVTLAGAHAEFQFTNDQNGTNDYVAVFGNVNLPVLNNRRIGIRLYFDGHVDFIGLKDPVGQTFNIPAGSDMYMLTAAWENDVGNVPIEITDPNGITYTEAEFDNLNIGVIDLLSGATSKSIGLKSPLAGNWTINIPNEVGLGQVAFHGFYELAPPTLTVNSANVVNNQVTVGYDALADDPAATVAWYYDTDDSGFDGTLIAANIAGLGTAQTYNWDTAGIAAGTYHIYGKVDDGINPSVFAYAPNSVTIENLSPAVNPISPQQVGEGQTLTLTAIGFDANGDSITYSLANGAPAGMDIDPATGELTWTPTEAQGGAIYTITIIATDTGTPVLTGSQSFDVTVIEQNEVPVIGRLFAQSRQPGGTFSFTAVADDADSPVQTLQFSLDAGAPNGATIDPQTGAFLWPVGQGQAPGVYPITIRVTDDGINPQSSTATVNLTVNAATVVATPGTLAFNSATYSVDEGGQVTITVKRTGGSDGVVAVQYSASGVTATDGLDFTATAGYLVFPDGVTTQTFTLPALFDIGTEGPETLTIALSNAMGGADIGDQSTTTVTIVDVVSVPPVFTSPNTFNVPENQTAVGLVVATDSDIPAQTVTFSITGGDDSTKFNITSGGALTFKVAPDFESPADSDGNNTYKVQVTADDGRGGTTLQLITVTVTAVNDNSPIFTSDATFEAEENQTAVGTVTATDDDSPADTVTFSITGGADAAKFLLSNAGVLTFGAPLDFEHPTDANTDGIYALQVTASDGHGHTTVQNISVTLLGVNDNSPVFTSSSTFNIAENATQVGTVTATDADLPTVSLFYTITGGADAEAFTITPEGVLSFQSAPDFELPDDVGGNNVYEVQVTVDDGEGRETVQNITVTVTDVVEVSPQPQLTLGGGAVTWINKQPAVNVFPSLTVGGAANLNGGRLTISINAAGTPKKVFDKFVIPSASAFGTIGQPQVISGRVTLQVQLNGNATNALIQSFLRGITFATSGKGLKQLTRTVIVSLADSASHVSSVTQTINVKKKA